MTAALPECRMTDTFSDDRIADNLIMLEMNHRVANSLQMASGILLLRARRSSPEVTLELTDVAARISAIAVLHRRLCYSNTVQAVDLASYLAGLCREIGASTIGGNGAQFTFTVHGAAPLQVRSDKATHVGLIVAELATNSAKYGGLNPDCQVELFIEPDELKLSVSDRGPGLPADFLLRENKGVGFALVKTLLTKLQARIEVAPSKVGARFTITMPRAAIALHPSIRAS